VTYGGSPGAIPGGTGGTSDGGWYRTASGGAFAAGEPSSASAWYPVNEHPADTATFAVTATVPQDWNVISNGLPQTDGLPDPGPGKAMFRWQLSDSVASYLTTIYIDQFSLVEDTLSDGTPIVSAIAPSVPGDQDVARIGPGRHRGQHQPGGRRGRQVLERMDGEVDPVFEQRVPQRGDEHPGTTEAGQRCL
jgi:hypothetical protein